MNLQKKGVKRIAVNVLIITKKTQKGDPAMKIIILANEFDTKPNRVTYIHIVATAQTDKELKAMGY